MNVICMPGRKLDAISEWMLKNDIPLTRENWIRTNWMFESDEKIQALIGGRGDAEELAEIPHYLAQRGVS